MERFDFKPPPFDHLNNTERLMLEKAVDIALHFNDEEIIIRPQQPIEHLYVVIKGLVKENRQRWRGDRPLSGARHFLASTRLDGRNLLSASICGAGTNSLHHTQSHRARHHAFQPPVSAYFYTSVAEKMASLSGDRNNSEFESLFTAKVSDAYRQNTVGSMATPALKCPRKP